MGASSIKQRLNKHLNGGEAFGPVGDFLEEITWDQLGVRPEGLPYSFYEVFYHMTYAQKDILEFCVANEYHAPQWPDNYWPPAQKPTSEKAWKALVSAYKNDRAALSQFLMDTKNDLLQPVKNGEKEQTSLRELLLVIEHNAYHTGQLVLILRLLGLH